MAVATAHLIHGFIGAGKTTFARRLEESLGAQRFTHDEWMVARHGQAPPEHLFSDYFAAISEDIWRDALRRLASGSDVILDLGCWTRDFRIEARRRVETIGARARFYKVECPLALMRERTLARSADPPDDSLWIDGPAFDKLLTQFEPMSDDESFEVIDGTCLQT